MAQKRFTAVGRVRRSRRVHRLLPIVLVLLIGKDRLDAERADNAGYDADAGGNRQVCEAECLVQLSCSSPLWTYSRRISGLGWG